MSYHTGRLIQITLAVYLLPVLLPVLAVGGIGIILLAVSQLFVGPIRKPASCHRSPA